MSIIAKLVSGTYTLPPAGTHIARCYGVVDLGKQRKMWNGQSKMVPQVDIKWELCNELMDGQDGEQPRPFSVTKRYSRSLGDKAELRHDLEAWLGRQLSPQELAGFQLSTLLGTACLVTILHERGKADPSKTYARVKGISPLAKGQAAPPVVNTLVQYEVEQGRNDTFRSFPERLQQLISGCEEWKKVAPTGDEIDSGLLDL